MRTLLFLCLMALPLTKICAQQPDGDKSLMNQTNKKGQRTGLWLVQQPERMGEEAYGEFGTYLNGRKTGVWYRMTNMGEVQAIEHYKDNLLDGEVKYFEAGRLVCIGHYRGLNPDQKYDTIFVMDPITQAEKLVRLPTDRGTLKHGTWRFYDPETGRLTKEEEWSVDELISRNEFTISKFDSAYYERRVKAMPHSQKRNYMPPASKRSLTR